VWNVNPCSRLVRPGKPGGGSAGGITNTEVSMLSFDLAYT
jgi:hypothetical protein